jgi:phosphoribosylformylglycinamidine (FGAM) synthase-like amidotransferase family enzyme
MLNKKMEYLKIITVNHLIIVVKAGCIEENKKYPEFMTIHSPIFIEGDLGFLSKEDENPDGSLKNITIFLNKNQITIMMPYYYEPR